MNIVLRIFSPSHFQDREIHYCSADMICALLICLEHGVYGIFVCQNIVMMGILVS